MDVAVFGGREVTLPAGWQQRKFVTVFGSVKVDARAAPGPNATLTFVSVLGGGELTVAPGTRVNVEGFSFLGGRKVETTPGDGPELTVRAYTVLGGLEVRARS